MHQPKLLPTRADYILPGNTTPKRLAARTKRKMTSIRENIETLSAPWIEIDNSVEGALDELIAAFDEFERQIDGSVDYLLETAPYS